MKLLVFLIAVLALLWLVRGSVQRRMPPRRPEPPREPPGTPRPMLQCAQCGLHLPRDEALPGRGGLFCCAAHRAAYEQAHPGP